MIKRFELRNPLDMHVHFRTGAMMRLVAPLTAEHFSGALIMPNTHPEEITTIEQVVEYKQGILDACDRGIWCKPEPAVFEPYMTLFFKTSYTREFLEKARPYVLSVKLYPQGVTTNSDHGVDPNDPEVETVLGYLEELGIPLNVHGETKGFVLNRESEFLKIYDRWARKFKNLKIIMEHITTLELVRFLAWYPNVFATVTVHHLLCTLDDVLGGYLMTHLNCKPTAKHPHDREALREIVLSKWKVCHEKVMLGTDSAPHPINKKEAACGCAGVFTAPIALQLLANEFALYSDQDHFQRFVSDNACRIYGLNPPGKMVVLENVEAQPVPKSYVITHKNCESHPTVDHVVPGIWGGTSLPWRVSEVVEQSL